MQETTFANTDLSYFQFYFQKNHGFIGKRSPSEKVEEELDYIDIDDIGNLEDSPILVLLMRNVGMYHSST